MKPGANELKGTGNGERHDKRLSQESSYLQQYCCTFDGSYFRTLLRNGLLSVHLKSHSYSNQNYSRIIWRHSSHWRSLWNVYRVKICSLCVKRDSREKTLRKRAQQRVQRAVYLEVLHFVWPFSTSTSCSFSRKKWRFWFKLALSLGEI